MTLVPELPASTAGHKWGCPPGLGPGWEVVGRGLAAVLQMDLPFAGCGKRGRWASLVRCFSQGTQVLLIFCVCRWWFWAVGLSRTQPGVDGT